MPTSEIAVLARLATVEAEMRRRLEKGWGKACEAVGEYAQEHHNYQNRSGDTQASTKGGLLDNQHDANKIVGVVTAGMPYDVFLETTKAAGGEAAGEGRYIREAWAFITPAIRAKQGDMLRIAAEEAKD